MQEQMSARAMEWVYSSHFILQNYYPIEGRPSEAGHEQGKIPITAIQGELEGENAKCC
jgi:hypothetical protein